MIDDFDPKSAEPADDDTTQADAKAVDDWAVKASPGVKPTARKAAAAGMVLAFKGNDLHGVLRHSIKLMPGAVRKGIQREWNRAVAGSSKKQSQEDWWAENGTRVLNERFVGRGSWRAQAKNWLQAATSHVQQTVGLRADEPAMQALQKALNPS